MSKPLVSVILPNYNHARYLPQRWASIRNQSYRNLEILLLDDASTDGSAALLERFAAEDERAQLHLNLQNSGSPFAQWQKGMDLAQGKYLWIAESDDFSALDLIEKLIPLLEDNAQVGLAYAQSMLVDEQGEELNSYAENLRFLYKSEAWQSDFIKDGRQACREWFLFHNPVPNASGAVLRRAAVEKIGLPNTTMRLNGDWHYYVRLMLHYDLAFKAEVLNYFRVHPMTQRHQSRKRASIYLELKAINDLIRSAVPEAAEDADRALRQIGTWWMGNLPYHPKTQENRRVNRQLFRVFQKHFDWFRWRIFLTYLISYSRDLLTGLGLLKPLKKMRKQLWPKKYWHQ